MLSYESAAVLQLKVKSFRLKVEGCRELGYLSLLSCLGSLSPSEIGSPFHGINYLSLLGY